MTNPNASKTPFDAAVDEVRSKIQGLQTTLDTLVRLQADYRGSGPVPVSSAPRSSQESELQRDTFFGMTIGDAANKYLGMMKTTKSTAEIATAIEQGGLKHSSKNFTTTVRSILGTRDDFSRAANGEWGLAEWHPDKGRGSKSKPDTLPSKIPSLAPGKTKVRGGKTRKERVLGVMHTQPNKSWTAGEINKILDDKRKLIQVTLGMLKLAGVVTKDPLGYRLAAS